MLRFSAVVAPALCTSSSKAVQVCRAVKVIDKRRLPPQFNYYRELLVMTILAKHPPLFVKFLGWFEKPDYLYIAMEHLEKGDLRKHMDEPLPQETVRRITKQLLEGLKLMHEKGIAHRDLKPEVKLGDFGVSKRVRAQDHTTFHTQISSRFYTAPEILGLDSTIENSVYTPAVDIWSLGCVIYELLAGTRLFTTEGLLLQYFIKRWAFPEDLLRKLPSPMNDSEISFIKSMLSVKPEDRPTVLGSLGDTWIASLESRARHTEIQDDHKTGMLSSPSGRAITLTNKKKRKLKRTLSGILADLAKKGIHPVYSECSTLLHWAAENGNGEVVKMLFGQTDFNPDMKGIFGQTPLHAAARKGHEGVVKILLTPKDVNPNMKDRAGQIPLHLAALEGHEGVVKILLTRKDVNPNTKDVFGQTPLHLAARRGYERVAEILLTRKDVNPNIEDNSGQMPLHSAARVGHEGVVEILLTRKDVNPNYPDILGKTPLRAIGFGHLGVVYILSDRANVASPSDFEDPMIHD